MCKKCKHCGVTDENQNFIGNQCRTCKNGLDRYGMNRLDQIALYESQNKKCKLCDKEIELFSRRKGNSGYIDHDHSTGKVRAVLCHPCNTALGYIENNLDLTKVKDYICP